MFCFCMWANNWIMFASHALKISLTFNEQMSLVHLIFLLRQLSFSYSSDDFRLKLLPKMPKQSSNLLFLAAASGGSSRLTSLRSPNFYKLLSCWLATSHDLSMSSRKSYSSRNLRQLSSFSIAKIISSLCALLFVALQIRNHVNDMFMQSEILTLPALRFIPLCFFWYRFGFCVFGFVYRP